MNNTPPQDEMELIKIIDAVYAKHGFYVQNCQMDGLSHSMLIDLIDYARNKYTVRFSLAYFMSMGRMDIENELTRTLQARAPAAAPNWSSSFGSWMPTQQNFYSYTTTSVSSTITASDLAPPVLKPLEDLGLAIEPIVGHRGWKLYAKGYKLTLVSRNGIHWPMRQKLVAFCKDNELRHIAPDEHCSLECGIYAYNHPTPGLSTGIVHGEVYLWGTILMSDLGYRAEYAYPKSLYLVDNPDLKHRQEQIREQLEENYGVPVEIRQTEDES